MNMVYSSRAASGSIGNISQVQEGREEEERN